MKSLKILKLPVANATAALRLTAVTLTIAALWVLVASASAAFAAPSWLSPTDLSHDGYDAINPQVALNANGEAVAVWSGNNGATNWGDWRWRAQAATRPAGGRWSDALNLSYMWHTSAEEQVALNANREAVAVWSRRDGTNWTVQTATRLAGGEWSDPRDLSLAGQNAIEPQVALNANGEAVAVWAHHDGTNYRVQAATRPAGGPRWRWSDPRDLSHAGQNATAPQVALNSNGDAVAVWDYDGATSIQAATRPAGGEWSAPSYLSLTGQRGLRPQVALNANGDAVAVWKSFDGANERVQAATRPAGGEWSVPRTLSADMRDAHAPQVALNANGDAVVVWYRRSGVVWRSRRDYGNGYDGIYGYNFTVQTATRHAGGEWSVRDLSRNPSYPSPDWDATAPQVALNASGDAVVVWQRRRRSNRRSNQSSRIVQAATRHTRGGEWSEPVDLSHAGQDATAPQVAIDASGGAVAVWYRSDGTNWRAQEATYAHLIGGKVVVPRRFPRVWE